MSLVLLRENYFVNPALIEAVFADESTVRKPFLFYVLINGKSHYSNSYETRDSCVLAMTNFINICWRRPTN